MSGPVGLVGTDESTLSMADLDRELLAATGRERPRIAVIALASNGHGRTQRAGLDDVPGADRFRALGAEVEPILVGEPAWQDATAIQIEAAVQAIGEADIVYLANGSGRQLSRAIVATPLGDAVVAGHRRGAIVVGCATGAMLLGVRRPELRRLIVPTPLHWVDALDLVPDVVVLPAYDARPEAVMAAVALLASHRSIVLGIDRDTAAIGRDGSMRVYGRGRVTVWRGRHRERFRRGETLVL